MNILFIGDIVGKPGRRIVSEELPKLIEEQQLDVVIANGENAAGGKGITLKKMAELSASGIQVFTLGNHLWADKETLECMKHQDESIPLVRAANFVPGSPGQGYFLHKITRGKNKDLFLAVVALIGRSFMKFHYECPFRTIDSLLNNELKRADLAGIIVDFHAETTAEKIAMQHYLDGRVTALVGTHTHIPTCDYEVSRKGTGYITDVGMCGPYNSVIGMNTEDVLQGFLTQMSTKFVVASGPAVFNAVLIKVNNGLAQKVERITKKEIEQ